MLFIIYYLYIYLFIFIYIFIYIFILYETILPPQWGRHASTPKKGEKKERTRKEKMEGKTDRGTEGETPHPKPGN